MARMQRQVDGATISLEAPNPAGPGASAGAVAPTLRCRYPARPGQAGTKQGALRRRPESAKLVVVGIGLESPPLFAATLFC